MSSPEKPSGPLRIESIDVVKTLAIFSVIVIHLQPFRVMKDQHPAFAFFDVFLNQTARFAVPCFFIFSGYLWGLSVRHGRDRREVTSRTARRLLFLFVAWSIIYTLPYNISNIAEHGPLGPLKHTYWTLHHAVTHPVTVLFEGTAIHLWFLMSLLNAVLITHFMTERNMTYSLIALGIVLYVVGLAAGSYSRTAVGIEVDFKTRNGPFFSTIFFVIGYLFSGTPPKKRWFVYGIVLFIAGAALQFLESRWLARAYGADPYPDYVLSTLPMGLGAAMIGLSNIRQLRIVPLAKVGRDTLGIYTMHVLIINLLTPVDIRIQSLVWEIAYPMILFVMTYWIVLAFRRHRRLATLVS